jgi:chlorite dismutase
MTAPLLVRFTAGERGPWRLRAVLPVLGESLAPAPRLHVQEGPGEAPPGVWALCGVTSNLRYTTAEERAGLLAKQEGLGRPPARHAALIPISKNAAWWAMAQDERRAIMETRSRHNAIGMEYLPEVARRLHHCRDLGGEFDFLTWFEWAPEHEAQFEELLARLRASEEWGYVSREVDIRLVRD